MAGPRQPIELIITKGQKHLTKQEIADRRASEVTPATDDITPPSYLTAAQKKHFNKLAGQLEKIRIMGETDVDTLARYVVAEDLYEQTTKKFQRIIRSTEDPFELEKWSKLQDRYYKQAQTSARDLGLTISSRCKLVVPKTDADEPKVNKFAKFGGKAAGSA